MAVGVGGNREAPGHDFISSTTDHGHEVPPRGERRNERIDACMRGPCIPAGLPSPPLARCALLCRPHTVERGSQSSGERRFGRGQGLGSGEPAGKGEQGRDDGDGQEHKEQKVRLSHGR